MQVVGVALANVAANHKALKPRFHQSLAICRCSSSSEAAAEKSIFDDLLINLTSIGSQTAKAWLESSHLPSGQDRFKSTAAEDSVSRAGGESLQEEPQTATESRHPAPGWTGWDLLFAPACQRLSKAKAREEARRERSLLPQGVRS